jgi:hypothetical protein
MPGSVWKPISGRAGKTRPLCEPVAGVGGAAVAPSPENKRPVSLAKTIGVPCNVAVLRASFAARSNPHSTDFANAVFLFRPELFGCFV